MFDLSLQFKLLQCTNNLNFISVLVSKTWVIVWLWVCKSIHRKNVEFESFRIYSLQVYTLFWYTVFSPIHQLLWWFSSPVNCIPADIWPYNIPCHFIKLVQFYMLLELGETSPTCYRVSMFFFYSVGIVAVEVENVGFFAYCLINSLSFWMILNCRAASTPSVKKRSQQEKLDKQSKKVG